MQAAKHMMTTFPCLFTLQDPIFMLLPYPGDAMDCTMSTTHAPSLFSAPLPPGIKRVLTVPPVIYCTAGPYFHAAALPG
jgi:hypothetical protein